MKFHVSKKSMDEELEGRFAQAWEEKRDNQQCNVARSGDHVITSFECDLCIHRKLKGRKPMPECQKDKVLMSAIRRVTLDDLWSREPYVVMKNRSHAKKIASMSSMVGLDGQFISFQPMPLNDHCEYEIAISMVLASRLPGKHSKSYTQFDTV